MSTLLPLERWRDIIGFHPFHFYGLSNSNIAPTSACNDLVTKYNYQNADAAGRQDILEAIEAAERKIREYLNYSPAPHWVIETLQWPKFYQTGMNRISVSAVDGRWPTVQAREGKIQAVGVEALTLIETITVTYSDADGDGINDTFTATTTVTTTETDIEDIGVYFSSANRLDGQGAGDESEIRPVTITINANETVTIRGRAWLLVRPILYEGVYPMPPAALDPTVAGNFVTTVDVYRHYTNPDGIAYTDSQAALVYETGAYVSSCCGDQATVFGNNSLDPAAQAFVVSRAGIRNAEIGELSVGAATYNATTLAWSAVFPGLCNPPDRVIVRYKAGVPLVNGQMDRRMQVVIARMACAELSTRPTACDFANRNVARWQFDLGRAAGNNDEQYRISNENLANPFGTRAGHVEAWQYVREMGNTRGFAV